jgi:hypothetical protein
MRKLLFTALAVLGFVGVSRAITKESRIEPVNKENSILFRDCVAFGGLMADAQEEIDGCFTSSQYNHVRSRYKALCDSGYFDFAQAYKMLVIDDEESLLHSQMLKNRKK